MTSTAGPSSPSDPASGTIPTRGELFGGFLKVGLQGFGGVLPFARRTVVEQRRWLDEGDFVEVLSLSQFLPGPNIVNVAVIVGNRFRGPLGALVAVLGLLLMPFVIVLALAALYAQWSGLPAVRGAAYGVTSAATGLIIATGLKMASPIRRVGWQVVAAAATFGAIGVARLPLLATLAVIVPVSIGIAWRRR